MVKKLWFLLSGFVFLLVMPIFGQDCDLTGYRIYVDPGHGGSDPGAIGPTGYREKDATLSTGLFLRDWLQALGATVGISRTSDVFVSLSARANMANNFGADRFMSVHFNAFGDPSANGTETYVFLNPTPRTRDLGQSVQNELVAYLGLRDRGLKTANFAVLRLTRMPAELAESAFITNPYEESLLRDPDFLNFGVAAGQAQGLCDHLANYPSGMEDEANPELNVPLTLTIADSVAPSGAPRNPVDWSQPVALYIIKIVGADRSFHSPRYSPNGRFLTFAESGRPGLYLMDTWAADSTPQLVTAEAGASWRSAWSPDSRILAYSTRNRQGYSAQWVNLFTGESGVVPTVSLDPVFPEFTPDGNLLLVDAQTGAAVPIPSQPDDRRGSPASPRVFVRKGNVWMAREEQMIQLTRGDMSYWDAAPSPDGSYALGVAGHAQGEFLFNIDTRSGEAQNLSLLGVGREGPYNLSYEGAWSPDGQHVLVTVSRDDGYMVVGSDLYITDRTGSQWRRLDGGGPVKRHTVWSAADRIAFDDGDGHVIVAELSN